MPESNVKSLNLLLFNLKARFQCLWFLCNFPKEPAYLLFPVIPFVSTLFLSATLRAVYTHGTKEMVQWLKALTPGAEDPDIVPAIHMATLNNL